MLQGCFGSVYRALAITEGEGPYAFKVVEKDEFNRFATAHCSSLQVTDEIQILNMLRHPTSLLFIPILILSMM